MSKQLSQREKGDGEEQQKTGKTSALLKFSTKETRPKPSHATPCHARLASKSNSLLLHSLKWSTGSVCAHPRTIIPVERIKRVKTNKRQRGKVKKKAIDFRRLLETGT